MIICGNARAYKCDVQQIFAKMRVRTSVRHIKIFAEMRVRISVRHKIFAAAKVRLKASSPQVSFFFFFLTSAAGQTRVVIATGRFCG